MRSQALLKLPSGWVVCTCTHPDEWKANRGGTWWTNLDVQVAGAAVVPSQAWRSPKVTADLSGVNVKDGTLIAIGDEETFRALAKELMS